MSLEKEAEQMMKKSLEHLGQEYKSLRSNRVNPSLLDSVMVMAYGAEVALKTVATISVQERNLIVTPFDPSIAQAIEKAINGSNLNLNGASDSGFIRVPIPPLNTELRKDVVKQAKQKLEHAKISIRDVRRKSKDEAKKQKTAGSLTEDDIKNIDKKLQTVTDDMCKKLDSLFAEKEKEIMTV